MTPRMYEEALITKAWVEVSPITILTEIETTLDIYDPEHENFKYKVVNPLYPLEYEKLTNEKYYEE